MINEFLEQYAPVIFAVMATIWTLAIIKGIIRVLKELINYNKEKL